MTARLTLQRKSGYLSDYSLAMIYPMWKSGRHYQGQGASPIVLVIRGLAIPVWPSLIRFPSFVARKVQNRDAGGFIKDGQPDWIPTWKRGATK